jgi:catalase
MHALMQLFGQRGVPESLRHINMYGVHTFKFGKPDDGSFKYVKIHFKPDAGNVTMDAADAVRLAGEEPDYHVKDMYNAIEKGDYPTWTMNLQVMDPKDAETYRWNIFDDTRIWPHKDYPLIPVGKLTLNKNPDNYHSDVEQAAFSPSTLVPGIGPSADLMLQARMFSVRVPDVRNECETYADFVHQHLVPRRSALPRRSKLPAAPLQRRKTRLLTLPTRRPHASRRELWR